MYSDTTTNIIHDPARDLEAQKNCIPLPAIFNQSLSGLRTQLKQIKDSSLGRYSGSRGAVSERGGSYSSFIDQDHERRHLARVEERSANLARDRG